MAEDSPLQSLNNVSRSTSHLWIDGHTKDLARLEEFEQLHSLSLYRLSKVNVPVLAKLSLPKLSSFGLRLAPLLDFHSFSQFKNLKEISIWQCSKLRSLDGLEALSELTLLYLSDLGALLSLDSIEHLPKLEKLYINGSMNTTQKVNSFLPIGGIDKKLSILELSGTQSADKQLHPLVNLPEPDTFSLTPWLFPLEEVALVAAAYPKWRKSLIKMKIDHFKKCTTCGGKLRQTFAYRSRAKCPSCEVTHFEKFDKNFFELIEEKKNLLRSKP